MALMGHHIGVSSWQLIDYWKMNQTEQTLTQMYDLLTNSLQPKLVRAQKYIETVFNNATGKLIVA